jgi:hypothetical protein
MRPFKRLRDALGDSAENPRFVETVARRGYRFMGIPAITAAPTEARARSWQWLFAARNAVLGGLTVCAFGLFFLYYSHSLKSKAAQPTVTPVVTNVGEKYTPSLSPDGQHLAFAWNGGAGPYFSIYAKIVGTHPETKCANSNGDICTQQTIGLLQRRHVTIDFVKYIGKESNSLEEVAAGTVHSSASVYTDYEDHARDEWKLKYLPVLKNAPLAKLVEMSGISRRAVIDARAGRSKPHRKNRKLLISVLRELGLLQE